MPYRSEVRDNMRIEWDVPIAMDDGIVLSADIFRPIGDGKHPVVMAMTPYGKGAHFGDAFTPFYTKLVSDFPEVLANSSGKYITWEAVDPERWVPDGYVCIRIDVRGQGRSPGYQDCFQPREIKDLHDCIEWAAVQPWSNGKVGLCGISYLGSNQWLVAGLQPPHLAAMVAWEAATDNYREIARHGGIYTSFMSWIMDRQVKRVQHGVGIRGLRSRFNGDWVSGPPTLTEEQLAGNRAEIRDDFLEHDLDDEFHRVRSAQWSKIKTPFLSCGNWGSLGIHLRGNVEAFVRAASKEKWLEIHGLEHWTHFYTDYGVNLQKRFLGYYLKGDKNDWKEEAPVRLQIRHPGNRFVERQEHEWPLKRTQWTKLYLDPAAITLNKEPPKAAGAITYEALGDGVTFLAAPAREPVEITGQVAAKVFVSSSTEDADLFVVLRLFAPDLREVTFLGVVDPFTPVSMGWLRASHRKLDLTLSRPYWPYHTHDEKRTLKPGEVVELDVEIWPTSVVVPPGHRLALTVRGRDYVHPATQLMAVPLANNRHVPPGTPTGAFPFHHDDRDDRPVSVFGGKVTIHAGPGRDSHLLLPVIPAA